MSARDVVLLLCCASALVFGQTAVKKYPAPQPSAEIVPKTPATILKENDLSLALIVSADDNSASLGSGFFIADGSAVVTNYHVIAGASSLALKTGSGQIFSAEQLYAFDEKRDLAIIKLPSPAVARPVPLGDSDKVAVGEGVVVIGNPEGLEKSVTNGLVSGLRTVDEQKLFQISAPISPGSSGGPVFNDKGEVIGVVVSFLDGGQNLNFAIPINAVKQLWSARRPITLAALPKSEFRSHVGAQPDVNGSWAATFADSVSSGRLSFVLLQDGKTVRGTYTSSAGGGGTIVGQLENDRFTFELTQSLQQCPGKFEGSADLRNSTMIGAYTGADCQGVHANGSFSMTKGAEPFQPTTPSTPPGHGTSDQPIIQYGSVDELRGVHKVFIYGADPDVRINMLKQFSKHPEVQVVGDIAAADAVLVFGAQAFSMGTHTNVWTDGNGNAHANTFSRYGITGQGSAVKLVPPNTVRVVWQFSATRTTAFQRRPSTNFIRDFVAAWEKANR